MNEDKKITKERIVVFDEDTYLAVVDDFEAYDSNEEILDYWSDGRTYEYQHKELSDDVSSMGDNASLKLRFKTNSDSPSYGISPAFGSEIDARVFRFDVKSEIETTVFLNFYVTNGNTDVQYRAQIDGVNDEWTTYIIGFAHIKDINDPNSTFGKNDIQIISKITFGMVATTSEESEEAHIYVDNLAFDGNYEKNSTCKVIVID